jgi:solute carrier family 13 (sodium-dependent dicarboxylate transporter), member 2/3/5
MISDWTTKDQRKLMWLLFGLISMFIIFFAGSAQGLSVQGQRVLGILAFAVVVWISQAISYPLSAIAIIAFLILSLGFAPAGDAGAGLLGTGKAITMGLSGFTNSGWVLVATGLFLSAIIVETGLEKRMALAILKIFGIKTKNVILGMILAMYAFTFFIPSATARAATLIPIALGLIETFKVSRKSGFAKALTMAVGISATLSGIGLLTGVAQNPVTVFFVEKTTGKGTTWMEWLIISEPFALVLAGVLYFLLTRMIKEEIAEIPGGKEIVYKELQELGPMSRREKKVFVILVVTIIAWATESFHKIDANTVSIFTVLILLAPIVGVTDWKSVGKKVDYGTLLLFAAGISLGEQVLRTGAATWLAKNSLGTMGVTTMPPFLILISIAAAVFVIRIAFSSSTSATATLIPTILGFLLSAETPNLPIAGMAIITSYILLFGSLLPVNVPQTMIAYGTDTFDTTDFLKITIPLSIIGFLIWLLFYATYWHWLGLV